MTNNFDFTHLLLLLVLTGSSHVHAHSLTHTPAVLFKVARALLLWQPSLIRAAMRRCRCEKSPNIYSQADIVRLLFSARCPQGQHCQHSAIVVLSFFEDTLFCSTARHSLLCSGFRAISGMDSGRLPLIIAASQIVSSSVLEFVGFKSPRCEALISRGTAHN